MAWMARLDAHTARWPRPARYGYLGVKWTLVVLGTYLLFGHFVMTWGWIGALWFLGAPLIYGLGRGLMGHRDL